MTKRSALKILIKHAAANVAVGMRPQLTEAARFEIALAVQKMYPDAYGWQMTDNDAFNLGLSKPREDATGE